MIFTFIEIIKQEEITEKYQLEKSKDCVKELFHSESLHQAFFSGRDYSQTWKYMLQKLVD